MTSPASITFTKTIPGRYTVFADGVRIGTVVDNGSRRAYLRNWEAHVGGSVIAKVGSRRAAADALLDRHQK